MYNAQLKGISKKYTLSINLQHKYDRKEFIFQEYCTSVIHKIKRIQNYIKKSTELSAECNAMKNLLF